MSDIKLDVNGDLLLTRGELGMTATTQDAAKQRTTIRLLSYEGEWYLDESFGVPYFDKVLIKNSNQGSVDAVFRAAILDDPEITAIEVFKSKVEDDTYILEFTARTTSGESINYVGQIG